MRRVPRYVGAVGTYWKLMRLDENAVILAEKQREPSLVFRISARSGDRIRGCNNLTAPTS